MKSFQSLLALGVVLGAAVCLAGCDSGGSSTPVPPGGGVTTEITAVSSTGAQGVLAASALPTGTGTAPMLTTLGNPITTLTIPAGGVAQFEVNALAPLSSILVGVQGELGFYSVSVTGTRSVTGAYTYILVVGAPLAAVNSQFNMLVVTRDLGGGLSKPGVLAVTVGPGSSSGSGVTVGVSPSTAALAVNATQQFTASVSGSSNTAVTWSVQEGASGGTVTSTGLYTAPASAGTYHVVATSQADATQAATASVTVTSTPPPPFVSIVVSPSTATLTTGGSQQFSAAVTGTSNTAATWSVLEGASGGTVTSAGVYTAPTTAGTYHVVATSQADATQSATATVTVSTGGSGGINPPPPPPF